MQQKQPWPQEQQRQTIKSTNRKLQIVWTVQGVQRWSSYKQNSCNALKNQPTTSRGHTCPLRRPPPTTAPLSPTTKSSSAWRIHPLHSCIEQRKPTCAPIGPISFERTSQCAPNMGFDWSDSADQLAISSCKKIYTDYIQTNKNTPEKHIKIPLIFSKINWVVKSYIFVEVCVASYFREIYPFQNFAKISGKDIFKNKYICRFQKTRRIFYGIYSYPDSKEVNKK